MNKGHENQLWSLAWSPDGTKLASSSNDTTVIIWDVKERIAKSILKGHASNIAYLEWSPDGTYLASCYVIFTKRYDEYNIILNILKEKIHLKKKKFLPYKFLILYK